MKIGKLITYNILALLLSLNIIYLYFSAGLGAFSLSKGFIYSILRPLGQILLLFISVLFINLSYIVISAKYKKNLLRISLMIISVLMIANIVKRILEYIDGFFWVAGNISMLLYIVLFIFNILILRDLFKLIKRLFSNKTQNEN